jgi:hypothetical protein
MIDATGGQSTHLYYWEALEAIVSTMIMAILGILIMASLRSKPDYSST